LHRREQQRTRHDKPTVKQVKPKPGFYTLKIGEHFQPDPDWHLKGMLHDLAARYHACLQAVVQTVPTTEKCLKACARCGILFLAHPRNASRNDLRCPFGCREIHRKERSSRRSVAYYRSPGGRYKKKALNGKRSNRRAATIVTAKASSIPLAAWLSYLCMALSVVERRAVTLDELSPILRSVRQHSIDQAAKAGYVADRATDWPP
jgi:hypothetical protein